MSDPTPPHRQQLLRGLTFDQLFAVRMIASAGSFREASKILCLSQPAISQRVQHIEHILGTSIFERHSGIGVSLTPAGETFLRFCDRAMGELDGLLGDFSATAEEPERTLTISAPSDSIQHFLIRLLPLFRSQLAHRQIRVTQSGSRSETVSQITSGAADLAFYRMPMDTRLSSIALMSETLHLVAVPSHEIFSLAPHDRPAALGGYSFATFLPTMRSRQLIERWAVKVGARLEVEIESQSISVMQQAVLGGSVLSVLPSIAFEEHLRDGRLRIVDIEGMPLPRATAIGVAPGNEHSPVIRELIELLIKITRAKSNRAMPEIRWNSSPRVQTRTS
ncbi:MAG: LysR family transcriptional regulator [Nocardioides sp.]|uniref:LysR family transcriptional regulator n=1 Tax=Nocardioides sp. TaxID=35761 RepID=UPI0039E627DA